MTKTMIEGFGWVYVVVVLDWHSKKVVGHYAGLQARAWHWLVALNRAVNRQFPHGIEGQSLHLMADNGCQPTSLAFMRACADLGIRQAFTSYSNPKGNADTKGAIWRCPRPAGRRQHRPLSAGGRSQSFTRLDRKIDRTSEGPPGLKSESSMHPRQHCGVPHRGRRPARDGERPLSRARRDIPQT
jgi:hypothetical protein